MARRRFTPRHTPVTRGRSDNIKSKKGPSLVGCYPGHPTGPCEILLRDVRRSETDSGRHIVDEPHRFAAHPAGLRSKRPAIASFSVTTMKALMAGSHRAIRASTARVTSTGDRRRAR